MPAKKKSAKRAAKTPAPVKKSAQKPSAKSSAPPAAKVRRAGVPQKHGGMLIPGAGGGPQPGSGRPTSVLREKLRGVVEDRVGILEAIVDGEPMVRTTVSLRSVLPWATCPNCGEKGMEATNPDMVDEITIAAKTSASPRDRIGALDLAAKYGVGTKDELSVVHPDVVKRLEQTVALIASQPEWHAVTLLEQLSPIWGT